jgi:hypothetical protein
MPSGQKKHSPPNWDTRNIFPDKLEIGTRSFSQHGNFLDLHFLNVFFEKELYLR